MIRQSHRRDSALYTCVASNSYGQDDTNIQLIIQEPPDSPADLKVTEVTSRQVKLIWTAPFTGNSPITSYVIQYKEETAPGGPPTDVQAVATVPTPSRSPGSSVHTANNQYCLTQPPPEAVWHGKVRGYYIGYREVGSDQPAMFKTVELEGAGPLEAHLTNLRRAALYRVSVQAFNGKGAGPRSDHEMSTPSLMKRNFDSPVTECTLYRRKDYGTWTDSAVVAQDGSVTVPDLDCGTRYFFYMVCHNSVGRSEPSETMAVRTSGGAPVSPSKEEFLQCDASSAILNLQAWQSSGCPITRFSLRLRRRHSAHWSPVAPVNRSRHTIQGLAPGMPYELQVTAFNSAGATEARYDFFTPNLTSTIEGEDRLANPLEPGLDSPGLSLAEVGILVPVVTAFVMVVLVVAVGCFLCRRRQSRGGHSCSEADITALNSYIIFNYQIDKKDQKERSTFIVDLRRSLIDEHLATRNLNSLPVELQTTMKKLKNNDGSSTSRGSTMPQESDTPKRRHQSRRGNPYEQGASVGQYCDQGAMTDLICSMDKTPPPPPQLAGIVIRVHGPIDLLHGQDTTTSSVGRYCDQGVWTDLICSMDKTPPPQLAGIVIRVHGPI
ncbi:Dscam [Cordylochernes scorpioides]|uniref:Dscam n=1 Tax=Cordylochernes scorpioides TaxID=51811 RepID=A0ABY6JZX8_9ARAC|nr:Dscam [Cordylochernes scorpioides]